MPIAVGPNAALIWLECMSEYAEGGRNGLVYDPSPDRLGWRAIGELSLLDGVSDPTLESLVLPQGDADPRPELVGEFAWLFVVE